MAEFDEKTEQATPRRRQKAREKGQVARSRELGAIAATGGVVLVLLFGGRNLVSGLMMQTRRLLGAANGEDPFFVLRAASIETMLMLLPILGTALTFAVLANVIQGGFVVKPIEMEFEKLNPGNGMKRLFSPSGTAEFLKNLCKFLIAGYLFYRVMKHDLSVLPTLMTSGLGGVAAISGRLIMKAVFYGFFTFLVFGAVDFFIERWRFERSIRMSREEMKEEGRETEGSPTVKTRMRSLQRDAARQRMMQEVPKATVVITNPVRLAIALRYADGKMKAPRIVAKGAGVIAARIREIASRHGIPIVENRPLARLLFKLDIGSYIPEELYRAVAKILAYIYKLKGARA